MYRLVSSRPIPDRLIEALAAAPLVRPDHIEMWTRTGGRITTGVLEVRTGFAGRGRKRLERPIRATPPSTKLTRRELQAIRLKAEGKTNKEVAYAMHLKSDSLNSLLATARFRLDQSPTNERAVLVAAARGLIELPVHSVEEPARSLSLQETQILAMVQQQAHIDEIAAAMETTTNAVKMTLRRVRRKLSVETTIEAARAVFG